MCDQVAWLAIMLLGIDVGWQPLPEGGVEYQIQVEPDLLENLGESGVLIQSDVPPHVRDIRAFRITVGKAKLSQEPSAGSGVAAGRPADDSPGKPIGDAVLPPPSSPSIPFSLSSSLPPMNRSNGPDQPREVWPGSENPPMATATDPPPASEASIAAPDRAAPADPFPGATATPRLLPTDPTGNVRQAAHVESQDSTRGSISKLAGEEQPRQQSTAKPWLTLTLAWLALFASGGLNVYLFWIAFDFRRRYRTLAGGLEANVP